MNMAVSGIHHVTSISADIVRNLEFYTNVLGLRLVKKSVNQDDVSAYHLFYADEVATPGTDLTFFDWPGARYKVPGPGQVVRTNFRVPLESFGYWMERLGSRGIHVDRSPGKLTFEDFEGQALAFVAADDLPNATTSWTAVIPEEAAIRGILGVDIASVRPDSTARVLTDVLGFSNIGEGVFEVQTENSFGRVTLTGDETSRMGYSGAGGVHHVAFRARDDEHLNELLAKVEAAGLRTSGYVDRYYFHSIYFREPGGVLFEIATDGPGMQSDEPQETLGMKLALPPFLEGRREEIEAGLKPLPDPQYVHQLTTSE